ncbi:type II toxin-antitoxin system RelE/ParE family toxin [Massilia sp. BJB1822]|uniref:type II toxin-antitoxin system RelE/ParE family toxin n=1 Tax=Massilia sp. BJB1822 TaxID=2744470 RepID=UPI001593D0CC|nr:type II toxin-antitoxin system RelE/ParE family toxin [Massilia sp. BJB1822]NVE00531.1 type II toxin-antitoxin system RelE/ParE family toxin [Massilia sp. BJB1822]
MPASTHTGFLTRVFKAKDFAKSAKRRRIHDTELCAAIAHVQAAPHQYSLGGGVYKKRLNDNMDRSIILAHGGQNWFYVYLFQKSDKESLDGVELDNFKRIAKTLATLTPEMLAAAIQAGSFIEICHEH